MAKSHIDFHTQTVIMTLGGWAGEVVGGAAISNDVLKFRKIIEFQSSWIVMSCQGIVMVYKTWWYINNFFFELCFPAKYNLKPNMYIVVILHYLYSFVFRSLPFSMFFFCLFSLFFHVFCTLPHNQENHDSK